MNGTFYGILPVEFIRLLIVLSLFFIIYVHPNNLKQRIFPKIHRIMMFGINVKI